MPELLERKLAIVAKRRFPNDKERQDNYIFDTLRRRFNWSPEEAEKHKKEMIK